MVSIRDPWSPSQRWRSALLGLSQLFPIVPVLFGQPDQAFKLGRASSLALDDFTALDAVFFRGGKVGLNIRQLGLEEIALVLEHFGRSVEGLEFFESGVEFGLQLRKLPALLLDEFAAFGPVFFNGGEIALEIGEL